MKHCIGESIQNIPKKLNSNPENEINIYEHLIYGQTGTTDWYKIVAFLVEETRTTGGQWINI